MNMKTGDWEKVAFTDDIDKSDQAVNIISLHDPTPPVVVKFPVSAVSIFIFVEFDLLPISGLMRIYVSFL